MADRSIKALEGFGGDHGTKCGASWTMLSHPHVQSCSSCDQIDEGGASALHERQPMAASSVKALDNFQEVSAPNVVEAGMTHTVDSSGISAH